MDERLNYFGANIFWLYIVAALAFTAIILKTLIDLEPAKGTRKHANKNSIMLFGGLALLSFAILSTNMLNVLISSYTLWSRERSLSLRDLSLESVWQWSITSTLFQDFGNAIVESSARYLWVEASLLATLAVCLFVGIEGQHQQIPRLWAFIGLSQILPVSFTQNLFYIALLQQGQTQWSWTVSRKMVVILSGAYCASLIVAPAAVGTQWLVPHILLARGLLVGMQVYPWKSKPDPKQRDPDSESTFMTYDGFVAHLVLMATLCLFAQATLAFLESPPSKIGRALFSHPAVSSLGCDLQLSSISYLCWRSMRDTSRETESEAAK